jgi:hypothetical protein
MKIGRFDTIVHFSKNKGKISEKRGLIRAESNR